ncbi:hypothetical protein RRG08_022422 [Elysia crispata]|uniref:Uncharacterized protein n=1 Tax=Elysia crispata TaxID=231223 RepID=A0AAE0Z1K9_9GAST|nr:hypothetical protein RRG08_022422 [Elysia crispata]
MKIDIPKSFAPSNTQKTHRRLQKSTTRRRTREKFLRKRGQKTPLNFWHRVTSFGWEGLIKRGDMEGQHHFSTGPRHPEGPEWTVNRWRWRLDKGRKGWATLSSDDSLSSQCLPSI